MYDRENVDFGCKKLTWWQVHWCHRRWTSINSCQRDNDVSHLSDCFILTSIIVDTHVNLNLRGLNIAHKLTSSTEWQACRLTFYCKTLTTSRFEQLTAYNIFKIHSCGPTKSAVKTLSWYIYYNSQTVFFVYITDFCFDFDTCSIAGSIGGKKTPCRCLRSFR